MISVIKIEGFPIGFHGANREKTYAGKGKEYLENRAERESDEHPLKREAILPTFEKMRTPDAPRPLLKKLSVIDLGGNKDLLSLNASKAEVVTFWVMATVLFLVYFTIAGVSNAVLIALGVPPDLALWPIGLLLAGALATIITVMFNSVFH